MTINATTQPNNEDRNAATRTRGHTPQHTTYNKQIGRTSLQRADDVVHAVRRRRLQQKFDSHCSKLESLTVTVHDNEHDINSHSDQTWAIVRRQREHSTRLLRVATMQKYKPPIKSRGRAREAETNTANARHLFVGDGRAVVLRLELLV